MGDLSILAYLGVVVVACILLFILLHCWDYCWGGGMKENERVLRLVDFEPPEMHNVFFYTEHGDYVPEFLEYGYKLPRKLRTGWGAGDEVESATFNLKISIQSGIVFVSYSKINPFAANAACVKSDNIKTGVARLAHWWKLQQEHQKPFHYLERKKRAELRGNA